MAKPGIYKIVNKINNKIYIGSATDLKRRWREHKYKLKKGTHSNKHLLSAWNKYGEDNFFFETIEEFEHLNKDLLLEKESYYIDLFDSKINTNGYNIREDCRSQIGYKHTEETKEKMRGRVVSEETRAILREYSKKQVPYWNGKQRDREVIEKMRNANIGRSPWNKGKKYSMDETIVKKRFEEKYPAELLEKIIEDYKELKSYRKVAKKYDIDRNIIPKLIKHFEAMKL